MQWAEPKKNKMNNKNEIMTNLSRKKKANPPKKRKIEEKKNLSFE